MGKSPLQKPLPKGWLLRKTDQFFISGLVMLALFAFCGILAWEYLVGPKTVEFDDSPTYQADYQVDLNTASWPELALLPGLGEGVAKRIVKQREEKGPYQSPDELLDINGIGQKTLDRIRPYLYVESETSPGEK